MILAVPDLTTQLKRATLFLDTNVFSKAVRSEEFFNFLLEIKESNCALATVPSVLFEVTRGSQTVSAFNERREVLTTMVNAIVPIDKWMNDIDEFSLVMAKQQPETSQYTDFLLAACLYKFQRTPTYLLSSDLKALPKALFDRFSIVTVESEKEVKNFGIYKFNAVGFRKAAASILSSSN